MCTGSDDQPAPAHTVSTSRRLGLPTEVTSSRGPWGRFSYFGNFQIARIDYANQVAGTFSPGSNGMLRPKRLRYQKGANVLYDSGAFAYDEMGNIFQIGSDQYRYDLASRLTYATITRAGSRWEKYWLDPFDNITRGQQENHTPVSYPLDVTTNRYLGEGDIEYDPAGNLIKIGPPSFTMRYDAFDMQVHFHQHVGTEADYLYAYGPGDRRILTLDTLSGLTTLQLRGPGGEVLREHHTTGSGGGSTFRHQKDLVHGPEGVLATVARSGAAHYFHKDHLGSPRAITDAAGALAGKHDYYPFGQETPNNPLHHDPTVKFTGHQRDLHGLSDYMLGRTCLFRLRRFASVDPARDGWNLYAYTANNPIKYVDPDGRALVVAAPQIDYEQNQLVRDTVGELVRNLGGGDGMVGVADAVASLFFPTSLEEFVSNQDPSDFINPIAVATAPIKKVGVAIAKEGAESLVQRGAQATVRFDPSRAGHVFREAAGHVNPASAGSQARFARLFENVASNPANLRADAVQAGLITKQAAEAGLQAFTWTGRSGQVWVTVRNGVVHNAGVNPLGDFR